MNAGTQMAHWSLDDIPWHDFDASRARADLIALVKAACMVEHNGRDYGRYLCEVFKDDEEFRHVAHQWAEEEVQHGQALRKWAELADPTFDFDRSFHIFTTGYHLPLDVKASVRGSRVGELVARCVVETGTSSYYTAIRESTQEPVLQAICAHIAADEFRHYKLFYTYLKQYLHKENVGRVKRLAVALGRIAESEDDELSYAFYAAHQGLRGEPYDAQLCRNRYLGCAYAVYRHSHVRQMTSMAFKVVGMKPHSWISRVTDWTAWRLMQRRVGRLGGYRQQVLAGV
jgi:rubrerythrin